jgi:hypothetical protein
MPVKESMNAEGFRKHRDIYTKKYLQILRKYHESLKKSFKIFLRLFLVVVVTVYLRGKQRRKR